MAERKRDGAHRFAGFEFVEDGVLPVLLFGREARSARRSLLGGGEQSEAAEVGDAIEDVAADFAGERQHGAQHFTDGREVVLRDPEGEFHQLGP